MVVSVSRPTFSRRLARAGTTKLYTRVRLYAITIDTLFPKPRKKITFDTVREMGLALPDVDEGTVYGSRLATCLPKPRVDDVDWSQRPLLRTQPVSQP
jgi:hypothetical protein